MTSKELSCLLLEDDYTPEGYNLLDTAVVGDYVLKLWEGIGHTNGEPFKFNEVSLNASGRSFDKESQETKYKGGTHALGHRMDFLKVIAGWLARFGTLYIGSYNPDKLSIYYKLFRRYLKGFTISEPYPAWDECEGKPEYFKVEGTRDMIESLLGSNYPTCKEDVLAAEAIDAFEEKRLQGEVNADNFCEISEDIVGSIVDKHVLSLGAELDTGIDLFNSVLESVLEYADNIREQ